MTVRFRVLGDVEAEADGRAIDVGHARQRCVLAVLLVEANRPVPVDVLIDRVWAGHPPQRARGAVYNYLSRLRRALAATGARIDRRPGGYALTVDASAVDLHLFRCLVEQARVAADDDLAEAYLDRSLRLWRGPPFAALDTPWLAGVGAGLEQERLAAELDRNDLALAAGRHGVLAGRLSATAVEHPLDERVAGQLMTALYRSGRQADALAHYEQVRRRLARELGADPGPELRRLHRRILAADPALEPPGAGPVVPRQLPMPPRSFVGRARELAVLDSLLPPADAPPAAATVCAITGTAGIGKTALAVYWAHRVADRFPDGQLYVDLRGFDPSGAVLDPAEAVRGFLQALGVAARGIPVSLDAQCALYRSRTAGKRLLIVVDNARDTAHVRPLLPAAPGCLVVVTSRDQLSGLVAVEGAVALTVDLLSAGDAGALLAGRLGPERVAADPVAAGAIIDSCARLPLALAIVAGRAARRPRFALPVLARELHHAQGRLDVLAGADPDTDLRTVLSWSYHSLEPPAARLFRLLGLHPGTDITPSAAARLADLEAGTTRLLLTKLADANLVTEHRPGRFRCHDLLRIYAIEQAREDHPATERDAAVVRLLDHYLDRAGAAARTPSSWLDAERANLVAACVHAAERGWTGYAAGLADVLTDCLDVGGHHADALRVHGHTRDAAVRSGDQITEARALIALGQVHLRRGEFSAAAGHLGAALVRSRESGDRVTESRALTVLGMVSWQQGAFAAAAGQLRHALVLCGDAGDSATAGQAFTALGAVHWARGEPAAAAEHLERGLARCRQAGDPTTEIWALTTLGTVYLRRGDRGRAADHLRQALIRCRQVGDPVGEAHAVAGLGLIRWRHGEPVAAADHFQRALVLCRQLGDRFGEAWAQIGLGTSRMSRGLFGPADEDLRRGLTLCREIGGRAGEAAALTGIGLIEARLGALGPAADHLRQASSAYEQIGDPAGEARALAGLGRVHARRGRRDAAVELLERALLRSRSAEDPGAEVEALTALGVVSGPEGQLRLRSALRLCRHVGYRVGEAGLLNGLGEALMTAGAVRQSRAWYATALGSAVQTGNLDEEARAHDGLARTCRARGDPGRAHRHWHRALTIYTDLELPDRARVRAELDACAAGCPPV